MGQDLKDRACLTHPLTNKSRWAINNGTSHTVVVIAAPPQDQVHQLPDLPWAYTWTVPDQTGQHVATFKGLARLHNVNDLRPANVSFEGNGSIKVNYRDNTELSPADVCIGPDHLKASTCPSRDMNRQLAKTTTAHPKGETVWSLELRTPPLLPPDWNTTYKKRWSAKVPNRWKNLWWLLARRSLFLGQNAARTGWDGIPHHCHHCNDVLESFSHLFYDCPLAQTCWKWCKRKWKASTRRSLTLTKEHALFGGDELWVVLSHATLYAIWKARCSRVFGNLDPHPLPILQHLLRHLISTLLNLNKPVRIWTRRNVFVTIHGADWKFVF